MINQEIQRRNKFFKYIERGEEKKESSTPYLRHFFPYGMAGLPGSGEDLEVNISTRVEQLPGKQNQNQVLEESLV